MPETAVAEQQTTNTETFAKFHVNRGSAAPADVEVKVSDPADTGQNSSAAAQPEGEKPKEPAEPKAADGSEPSDKQDKVEKRKQQIQREIDALVARREELRRETEKLASPSPKTSAEQPSAAAQTFDGTDANDPAPKMPSEKDPKYAGATGFELFEQDKLRYAVDLAKWEMRKDERLKSHNAAVEKQQKEHAEVLSAFEARGSEFAAEHEDYPELVDKFKNQRISNETAAVIVNADNGPAILHHLMTNPDELKRIEALRLPINRLDALYELKYKLRAPSKEEPSDPQATPAQPKPKSAAPAPGTRLNGGGGANVTEPKTFAAYRKQRSA